ncbi:MAG: ATP-binding protein [Gammaproteobacteria bacterium]|nr:ATP-binding protein [Gammaproteobacteria bacterium]
MDDTVPQTIWEVGASLNFDEPLFPDDPRFVDMDSARGEKFSYNSLLRPLGIDPRDGEMQFELKPDDRRYILFCGHRGCGKSTELRRISSWLASPSRYFLVVLDAHKDLDIHNLQYTDVLLAMARALLDCLQEEGVCIKNEFLKKLEHWFVQRIEQHEQTRNFAAEIKTGAKVEGGIPWLAKLFGGINTAFRTNSTYKEELRKVVKNHFSEFAQGFNQLIRAAEIQVREENLGRKLLFMVDGTDRLNQADSRRFFVDDAYQLQEIRGLFIYCAPIHLIYEHGQINQVFPNIFKLPMIKLHEAGGERVDAGYTALRDMLYRRAAPALFESEAGVDKLLQASGGHPRDLLRLLNYAFNDAEGELFDQAAIDNAIAQLATDYRRQLDKEDYRLLAEIDCNPRRSHNAEHARALLYNLSLLEYNSYWWHSHPVIGTLPSYQEALAEAEPQTDNQA